MTAGLPVPLLAAAEEPLVKLAIGVVVGLVWLVVQIYGALTKKGDKQVPPSAPRRTPAPSAPRPTRGPASMDPYTAGTVPPMNRQNSPPMRKSPPMRIPAAPKKKAVEKVVERRPEPQPTPRRPQVTPDVKKPAAATTLPRRQTLDALLKPRNLKKALVLTEILGKPVALRPPAEIK